MCKCLCSQVQWMVRTIRQDLSSCCQLNYHLHVSPHSLGFFIAWQPQGDRISYMVAQSSKSKCHSRQCKSCIIFSDLPSEVTWCHFCHTVLVTGESQDAQDSKGDDTEPIFQWKECQVRTLDEHVGWEILLQPSLKNISGYMCII